MKKYFITRTGPLFHVYKESNYFCYVFFRKDDCNHVVALLETLVDVTNKKKDGTLASTSSKCKWNNPRKRKLSPKKAQDFNISRIEKGFQL